jgi:Cu(I)/Ag(I) efflux system membrane protein CusA/SilA
VAQVQIGPDFRRGALDHNGSETVGGIVVMRFGANPRAVIDAVKQRISELAPSLDGVKVTPVYDRTGLIDETVATLSESLRDETLITVVVIVLFLLHVRASFVVAITLPLAVVMSFIGMWGFGIDANIMSLAGIAIAIGEVADLAIIVSENIYQHLVDWRNKKGDDSKLTRSEVIIAAAAEVAPAVVTAVSTTVISFFPVFFLTGRDYKLFAPLAYTKTFAMLAALVAAILLTPALCRLLLDSGRWSRQRSFFVATVVGAVSATVAAAFWQAGFKHLLPWGPAWGPIALGVAGGAITYIGSREQLRSVDENPTSRAILFIYEPVLRFLLSHKGLFAVAPATLLVLGLGAWIGLPTVLRPAESVAEWLGVRPNELPGYVDLKHTFTGLRSDDWIALDEGSWFYMPTLYPAAGFGQAMQVLQTQDVLIRQIPEVADVLGKIGRAESALDPAPAEMIETYVMLKPVDEWREGVTARDVWDEINAAATLPGVTPASPLQPIEGRVVMLQAGIKAPMAVRIYGDRLSELADAALAVADQLRKTPYVNPTTVNPDIVLGKPYVEFEVDRETAARYGMSVEEVNTVVEVALGGKNLITTVEGRERYPVRLRYRRDIREGIDELSRLPVVTPTGEVVPLEELASIGTSWGPGAISSENARLVAHVAFSPGGQAGDLETVNAVDNSLTTALGSGGLILPAGYTWEMVGSFQNQIEANRRLLVIIPLVVVANLLLIYLQFRSLPLALIIFSQIPVAFAGGMIGVAIADVEINTAVWIGFIALFGISVDDGVVMATYMEQLFMRRKIESVADLREATVEAGKRRIRPCLMTAFTTFAALTPVMLAEGRGADVAQAMALPVFAGMFIEMISLFVVPVFYCGFMEMKLQGGFADTRWLAHPEIASPA